ncbi:HIT family protein [Pseudomonas fluorescens]|uniref:HIT family protein n=1 Tax=Pseudomonas fluorescens TaxID=294 RepID=UPI00113267EC|nr:HIT family protein [Pseudomonas fluorescens]TMU71868.1 HIT family protein [Pseudomonas fluorescens]
MEIAPHFIVHETDHWIINHHLASALPGYLMLGTKIDTTSLAELSLDALAELGGLLARTQQVIERQLKPKRLYISRFGHEPGLPIHFHFIPVYAWVEDLFWKDDRYRALETFAYAQGGVSATDGAELTLFIWREFGENPIPPKVEGKAIAEVIEDLRRAFLSD